MRKAIAFPPTYATISKGCDAYMHGTQIRALAKESGRFWSFHGVPTTVALSESRYAKSLAGFSDHTDEDSFRELLREYADSGCDRPSGYADVFHSTFQSPRVGWSINSQLGPCLAGGWQQAIRCGISKGTYYKYDLRSAYLWAATLGMPDTRTYTRSLYPWKSKNDGVYRIRLLEPSPSAPFPFNQARECIATNHEIELYNLKVGEVVDGVVWKRSTPGDRIVDAVKQVSTWKQAGRSYWGRWGQMQKLTCVANGHEWSLPNAALNIPWAHLIISRVKMRLWEFSKNAVHVYVDSVITTEKLPIGEEIGDWRLEKTYQNGIFVRGPGQYGDVNSDRLERMAGVPMNSPQRSTSAAISGRVENQKLEPINANRTQVTASRSLF